MGGDYVEGQGRLSTQNSHSKNFLSVGRQSPGMRYLSSLSVILAAFHHLFQGQLSSKAHCPETACGKGLADQPLCFCQGILVTDEGVTLFLLVICSGVLYKQVIVFGAPAC